MAETRMRVVYDGEALQTNRMDVRMLSPALLDLASLFQEASMVINPQARPISLQVESTAAGSFDVHLVIVQDIFQTVVDLFTSDTADALLNLKEYVIGGGLGLFGLMKWIRSRRVRSAQATPEGSTTIVLEDGAQLVVASPVYNMYVTPAVRRHARGVVAPLETPGVDVLRFEGAAGPGEVIGSADVPAFDVQGDDKDEQLLDTEQRLNVTVVSVTFVEGNKWRFSDGAATFFATIADPQFLARVSSGEETFRNGDILDCRLRVQQFQNMDGTLTTDRTVLEVFRHRSTSSPPEPFPI